MSSTDDPSNHSDTLSVEIRVLPSELMLKAGAVERTWTYYGRTASTSPLIVAGTGTAGSAGSGSSVRSLIRLRRTGTTSIMRTSALAGGWHARIRQLDRPPLRSATDDGTKELLIGMPYEETGVMSSADAVELLPSRTPPREMDRHLQEEASSGPHQASESQSTSGRPL